MRKTILTLVAAFSLAIYCQCVWFGADLVADEKKPAEKKSGPDIEKLVSELGSQSGPARETATKQLLKIGAEALPYLKTAMKSDDRELRSRAEIIYGQIMEEVAFARAKNLGIDTLVERMASQGKNVTKEDWKLIIQLIKRIRAESINCGAGINAEPLRYVEFPEVFEKKLVNKGETLEELKGLRGKRVICDSADMKASVVGCLILAKGNVELSGICGHSVITANGDVRISFDVEESIIISDGNVHVQSARNSVIVARNTIKLAWPRHFDKTLLREKENGYSTHRYFFSPAALQLIVDWDQPTRPWVIMPGEKSPFGSAGLQQHDVLKGIEGAKVESEEAFRISVRSAVLKGESELDVERDKKLLRFKVKFD